MKKIHVCLLCHEYPPVNIGGIGAFTQTLARGLVNLGHKVTVIGLYNVNKETIDQDNGVTVIKIPASKIKKISFLINRIRLNKKIDEIYNSDRFDILEGPNSYNAMLSGKKLFPVVMRFHGGHRFFALTTGKKPLLFRSILENSSIKKSNYYCAVSNFNANALKLIFGKPEWNIKVIYNPVDTNRFKRLDNISPKKNIVLFIGTITRKKGVDKLIEAFKIVLRDNYNAQLWLIGREWIDPHTGINLRQDLEQNLTPSLKNNIIFKGPKNHDEIVHYLNQAAFCIFPSLMEGHPVVWLEAMSCSKTIIGGDVGAAREIINENINGLLCNPYCIDDIASKIKYALNNTEHCNAMGLEARRWVEEELNIQNIIKKNIDFYEDCINDFY
jgi:glycosyltransferase involved in cell wall biosynthesis